MGNDLTPSKLFTVPTRSFGGYIGGTSKSLSCCNSVGKCQMILRATDKKETFLSLLISEKSLESHLSFLEVVHCCGCYLRFQTHGWFSKNKNLSTVSQIGKQ